MNLTIKGAFVSEFKVKDQYVFENHPFIKRMVEYSERLGIQWKTSCGVYGFMIGNEDPDFPSLITANLPTILEEYMSIAECEISMLVFDGDSFFKRLAVKVKQKSRLHVVETHVHDDK